MCRPFEVPPDITTRVGLLVGGDAADLIGPVTYSNSSLLSHGELEAAPPRREAMVLAMHLGLARMGRSASLWLDPASKPAWDAAWERSLASTWRIG